MNLRLNGFDYFTESNDESEEEYYHSDEEEVDITESEEEDEPQLVPQQDLEAVNRHVTPLPLHLKKPLLSMDDEEKEQLSQHILQDIKRLQPLLYQHMKVDPIRLVHVVVRSASNKLGDEPKPLCFLSKHHHKVEKLI